MAAAGGGSAIGSTSATPEARRTSRPRASSTSTSAKVKVAPLLTVRARAMSVSLSIVAGRKGVNVKPAVRTSVAGGTVVSTAVEVATSTRVVGSTAAFRGLQPRAGRHGAGGRPRPHLRDPDAEEVAERRGLSGSGGRSRRHGAPRLGRCRSPDRRRADRRDRRVPRVAAVGRPGGSPAGAPHHGVYPRRGALRPGRQRLLPAVRRATRTVPTHRRALPGLRPAPSGSEVLEDVRRDHPPAVGQRL